MELDFATMNFAAAVASLLAALALAVLAAGHRREPALWWFAGAALAGAVGLAGFWMWDAPRPLVPRTVCNLLLIGDLGAILIGVLIFSERRVRPWRVLAAIVAVGAAGFGLIWLAGDPFVARLWWFALAAAALGAAIAVALSGARWRAGELERWPGARRTLAALFAAHAVFQLARAGVVTAQGAAAEANWISPGAIHVASTVDAIVLAAVFAWGIAALHGQNVASALHRLAHRDALTALPNRVAFLELFEGPEGLGDAEGASVVAILDLDDFKRLNDRHGHVVGDAFLEEIARRLERALRPGDTVARLGGDEFIILLRGVDTASARSVLRRLVGDLAGIPVADTAADASCSVGAALRPDDGRDFDTLYRVADERLYRAKAQGKGRGVLPTGETVALSAANA